MIGLGPEIVWLFISCPAFALLDVVLALSSVTNLVGTSRDNSGYRYRHNQSRSRDRGQRSRTNSRDRGDRSRSRSSSCVSTNRDRSRCYMCNEYDHFARECPNVMSDEEQDAVLQLLAQEEQVEALNYSESDLNSVDGKNDAALHFCHSPLKVVPISAASVKIIIKNLVNYQNTNLPDLSKKIRPTPYLVKEMPDMKYIAIQFRKILKIWK